jgi:hypothetical protein
MKAIIAMMMLALGFTTPVMACDEHKSEEQTSQNK